MEKRRLLDTELLIGVPKQVLKVSEWAVQRAWEMLPVLDGSPLETMRARVAGALDQAVKKGYDEGYAKGSKEGYDDGLEDGRSDSRYQDD